MDATVTRHTPIGGTRGRSRLAWMTLTITTLERVMNLGGRDT